MPALARFSRTALAGFTAAIALLALGMVLGVRSMNADARAQEDELSAKEHDLLLAEKLRWRGNLLVSALRGYVTGQDPTVPRQVREAAAGYDDAVRSFTTGSRKVATTNATATLAADVERNAWELSLREALFVPASAKTLDLTDRFLRFHSEMLPVHRDLDAAIDRFVNRAQATFSMTYEQAQAHRRRLTMWMYTSIGALVLASFGIARHVTTRLSRAFRNEQLAYEAARQASSARDELMAVVAHDLRNPLAAITIKAALLRDAAESDQTRKQAQSIENVTMRMDYLIQTMLDVVTVEVGQFSVKPQPDDAGAIVSEVIDMFDAVAHAKQLELAWRVTPPHLTVCADRERILQVLTNLVGNALKFTPRGGRVTITVDVAGDRARFSVADTGAGIAGEDLPNVFDRFWRKGATSQKGTGLGLFIARSIVVAHGGEIWVESELGQGSTFSFTLALA